MWERIARFVLKFRVLLLAILLAATAFMGFEASQVQMSYEFSRAIPVDHPQYQAFQAFKKTFGDDGNTLWIGIQTDQLFDKDVFNDYIRLGNQLKKVKGVETVLSIPSAIDLVKKDSENLGFTPIFPDKTLSQAEIDSCKQVFFGLPFYNGFLYNSEAKSYLLGVLINKDIMSSARRDTTVSGITDAGNAFGQSHRLEIHYTGLPLIRTHMATSIAKEMKWFLLGYVILSAFILILFFRSISTMLLSLSVVAIGVVWSLGVMHLFGYRITLLNALIPPLIMVIGIPNCIYFLNKYHTAFRETGVKKTALLEMIRRMGIVTLFCNITAAIGFAVFALTKSVILKEFGVVAGINIMMLFFISIILIPAVLSYLPDPKIRHTRYLQNEWLVSILDRLEIWTLQYRKLIFGITAVILGFCIVGTFRLRAEGFIVDDLPKNDPIFKDLRFFEKNFKGILPLEIIVDTRRKNGLRVNLLPTFEKIDSLSDYIASRPEFAKPLSIVELLKFLRQAYYNGDSADYGLPNDLDKGFLFPYIKSLNVRSSATARQKNDLSRLAASFIDGDLRELRINANMADVGSRRLPEILSSIQKKSDSLFDSTRYKVQLTGSSVTFLAGSEFIIKGLRQSIIWAFVLIAGCMLYLFRSFKILLCSLIPNVIPLIITAGIMGWTGVALKPSTVIVFSIALGIAIDITIRFLVNYKQDLGKRNGGEIQTVISTIHTTGISIIYTSLVLIAGFVIFCFSDFGGEQALGWLTSLTLVMATLTNLVFLPALLIGLSKKIPSEIS